ncbi:hypothetical protein CH252_18835 [Rhodococcus sp. 06-1477-1B]|nr:hypothetical protein CH252_18835 [Rhodococcus sp. 06-1477-1B]
MNTTSVPQTTDIHESLRHLLEGSESFDVRNSSSSLARLPEGDTHWIDQDEIRHERPDEMGPRFAVVRVWDLKTGERIFQGERPPVGWYPEQMGGWYDRLDWFARNHPNTYVVNGDYLFVSGGAWVITGMPNAEGEVEFTSLSSINAGMKADGAREQSEWLAEHAEAVAAVQPAWADEKLTWVDILKLDRDDDDDLEPDIMEFRRDVGAVVIEQSCAIDDGVFSLMGEPTIRITAVQDDHGVFSGGDAARIGVDMVAAAAMLGSYATVFDMNSAATAAGLDTGTLLERTGL